MLNNVLLAKCEYCGRLNCVAHGKYVDKCEECGKRYSKYMNYKSRQQDSYTDVRQRVLDDIAEEYRQLARRGYKVPLAFRRTHV